MIYLEENERNELPGDAIREAIRSYFDYKKDLQQRELKNFLKRARLFLAIGLFVLATCVGLAQNLTITASPGATGILREGVLILGWVSIWKPIELILFDWVPLVEKLRIYKKLLVTEIKIQFAKNE